ncbi:unnamed protein product [marine sediment metagenome]|uniref:Tyr recombinase domain-containing protein n=1 Tax=marine sediment metagenome TaxID=412755 RepID=X1TT59_9ZZZZ
MKTLAAIQSFLHNRRAQNLSPATLRWYEYLLGELDKVYPELPTDPCAIEAFLGSLADRKLSKESVHGYFRALKTFYRFLADRTGIPNPIARINAPRQEDGEEMQTLEPDELMRLLNSVAGAKLRDRAILTLFVDSGIRCSELTGLRRQDIRTETIVVSGKCGKREVPISEETKRLLLALIDNSDSQHVFLGHKGPLGKHGIYSIVRSYMRKAGISGPKQGPHRIKARIW